MLSVVERKPPSRTPSPLTLDNLRLLETSGSDDVILSRPKSELTGLASTDRDNDELAATLRKKIRELVDKFEGFNRSIFTKLFLLKNRCYVPIIKEISSLEAMEVTPEVSRELFANGILSWYCNILQDLLLINPDSERLIKNAQEYLSTLDASYLHMSVNKEFILEILKTLDDVLNKVIYSGHTLNFKLLTKVFNLLLENWRTSQVTLNHLGINKTYQLFFDVKSTVWRPIHYAMYAGNFLIDAKCNFFFIFKSTKIFAEDDFSTEAEFSFFETADGNDILFIADRNAAPLGHRLICPMPPYVVNVAGNCNITRRADGNTTLLLDNQSGTYGLSNAALPAQNMADNAAFPPCMVDWTKMYNSEQVPHRQTCCFDDVDIEETPHEPCHFVYTVEVFHKPVGSINRLLAEEEYEVPVFIEYDTASVFSEITNFSFGSSLAAALVFHQKIKKGIFPAIIEDDEAEIVISSEPASNAGSLITPRTTSPSYRALSCLGSWASRDFSSSPTQKLISTEPQPEFKNDSSSSLQISPLSSEESSNDKADSPPVPCSVVTASVAPYTTLRSSPSAPTFFKPMSTADGCIYNSSRREASTLRKRRTASLDNLSPNI